MIKEHIPSMPGGISIKFWKNMDQIIKEIAKQSLKKFLLLLFIFSSVSVINLHGADDCGNELIQVIYNTFSSSNKKLIEAISSLQEVIKEINNKQVKHLDYEIVSFFTIGDTYYTTERHHYAGNGDVIDVVNRYEKALNHFEKINKSLAVRDGVFLGVILAIMGEKFKWKDSTENIILILSSVFLTLAKSQYAGEVPYLTFPTLTSHDNYFGITDHIYRFGVTIGAVAISFFVTGILINTISMKMRTHDDVNAVRNFPFLAKRQAPLYNEPRAIDYYKDGVKRFFK